MTIDYTWQSGEVYRGYRWNVVKYSRPTYLSTSGEIVTPWVAAALTPTRRFHSLAPLFHLPPRASWRDAHAWRSSRKEGLLSYDHVPWEIHEIEDETAYHHALASYLVTIDPAPYAETYDQIIASLAIWR